MFLFTWLLFKNLPSNGTKLWCAIQTSVELDPQQEQTNSMKEKQHISEISRVETFRWQQFKFHKKPINTVTPLWRWADHVKKLRCGLLQMWKWALTNSPCLIKLTAITWSIKEIFLWNLLTWNEKHITNKHPTLPYKERWWESIYW